MNVATEKQVQIIRPLAEYSDNARIQRVAAYCRVSTDSDDQVNSFLNQVRYRQCLRVFGHWRKPRIHQGRKSEKRGLGVYLSTEARNHIECCRRAYYA